MIKERKKELTKEETIIELQKLFKEFNKTYNATIGRLKEETEKLKISIEKCKEAMLNENSRF